MKVRELIRKLLQTDMENTVYLETNGKIVDFTGTSFDDNSDISLYECAGDKEA